MCKIFSDLPCIVHSYDIYLVSLWLSLGSQNDISYIQHIPVPHFVLKYVLSLCFNSVITSCQFDLCTDFLPIRTLLKHQDSTGDSNKNNDDKGNKNVRMLFCKSSSSKPVVDLSQGLKLLKSSRNATYWCKQHFENKYVFFQSQLSYAVW